MTGLVDIHGQPLRRADLKRELTPADGRGIRTIHTQLEQSGVSIDRLAVLLREAEEGDPRNYLEIAELIEERDLHYLAVLGVRRRQVSQLPIRVVPADESAEAEADAELLREWLRSRELEDEIFDMLDAIGKGFSVAEIIWETSAREWMPIRLEHRLPQWFRFDPVSGQRLQRQDDRLGWIDLEPGKFVTHLHRAKSGLPIRGGLARPVAWAWCFKAFGLRDWLRFIKVYGHPFRMGRYHDGAKPEEKQELYRAVLDIASDAAAILPESMAIEFIENAGTGARSDLYKDLLATLDAAVSKAVLGQTLTTQEGESGSYSLGQVHDEVRGDIERADARQVAAALTNQLGRPMVLLNRGDPGRRGFPRFAIGVEEDADPGQIADLMHKVPRLKVRATQLRRIYGLEEPEQDDETVTGGIGAPPEAAMARAQGDDAMFLFARAMARAGGERDPDGIDQALAEMLAGDGWERFMDPIIGPVLSAAKAAAARGDGMEAFRSSLPEIFGRMDDAELLGALRRMGFSGRLSGDAGLIDRD